MSLASKHVGHLLEGEELAKQQKDFKGYKKGMVRLDPGRWFLPSPYLKYADRYYNFKFKPSDVLVMTWAKCGTTWTQEIIWTMRNNPNLDNPMAKIPTVVRVPFMEFDMIFELLETPTLSREMLENFTKMYPGRDPKDAPFLTMAECVAEPRTIKTHLPFSLFDPSLLDTTKVVAVLRNPKDVIVSFLHHSRLLGFHGYQGTFEDFVQYFIDGDMMYGPYSLHVKEVWEKQGHKNLHIMYFEDMKEDIVAELKKLDKFLGTNLSEEQLLNIAKYTSFSSMKSRNDDDGDSPIVNREVRDSDGGFFRKGVSGDWKNKFTPETEAKVDQWIEKNLNFGIKFKYSV